MKIFFPSIPVFTNIGSCKPSLIRRIILSLFIGSLIMLISIHEIQADTFEVGTGVVDVTPLLGYPHYEVISTGIRDPIYAKALVFKQGSAQGALMISNLPNISRDLSRIAREEVSKSQGSGEKKVEEAIQMLNKLKAPQFINLDQSPTLRPTIFSDIII